MYSKEDPEDKFAYHRTMLNLELSTASKLTKWITPDGRERIDKTKEALDIYKKLNKYIDEYMKWKGISAISEIEGGEQVH